MREALRNGIRVAGLKNRDCCVSSKGMSRTHCQSSQENPECISGGSLDVRNIIIMTKVSSFSINQYANITNSSLHFQNGRIDSSCSCWH